jgi:hypothetical protein
MTDLSSRFSTTSAINGLVAGRFGGRAVSLISVPRTGDPTICLARSLASPIAKATLGFAFQLNADDPTCVFIIVFTAPSGVASFSVVLDVTGTVAIWSGSYLSGTTQHLATSAAGVFTPRKWAYCGIQTVFNSTVGSVTVHIDGSAVLALSPVNTSADATGLLAKLAWQVSAATNTSSVYIDDMYLCDAAGPPPYNGFLGVCYIQTVYPTAAGGHTGFAPSGGPNWQMVSEHAMDGDATYNASGAANAEDTFTGSAGLIATAAIMAVEPQIAVRNDDAVDLEVATVLIAANHVAVGATTVPSSQYGYVSDIYPYNPANTKSWTAQVVSNVQFGYAIPPT